MKATDAADPTVTGSTGLTVYAGDPATVSVKAGSPQSATVGTGFAVLEAIVMDAYGNPVSGVTVTFTAPTSGATGAFAGASSATAVTDANGVATAPVFTAGTQAGGYTVTAGVAGVTTPASFSLTNNAALSVASTYNATVLQNVPSGVVTLATFNESGGSANPADYTATVVWGDGVVESSANSSNVTITVNGSGNIIVSGRHTYANGGAMSPTVTLTYESSSITAYPTIDVATNENSSAGFNKTGYTKNLKTGLFSGTLTVSNTSQAPMNGTLEVLMQGLPTGVTLNSVTVTVGNTTYNNVTITTTAAGYPVVVIPQQQMGQPTIGVGQSLKLTLYFNNPSNAVISYTPDLFSDPINT